eukprot:g8762.t1
MNALASSCKSGKPLLFASQYSRLLSIAKSPPPAAPSRAFLPQKSTADAFADSAPQLFVDQPENVTSTGLPPLFFFKSWTKNRGRNRRMKRNGYLTTEPLEEFGVPHFIMPGDEDKTPMQFLDMSIWENAAVLVNKPKRWTSFDVCSKIRNATFRYPFKVGHTGTLDPLATGLLVICMGQATKCVEKLTCLDKEYSGTMKLGETTASYDASEPVSKRFPWEHITDSQIEAAVTKFIGHIYQKPPMFSAVRQNGKRLYEHARNGKTVEREARKVFVKEFKIKRLDSSSPVVHYHIKCSKGTYIRSLIHDLGKTLGCGAYVRSLRRDAIGKYRLSDAWDLDKLLKVIEDSKTACQ